MGCGTRTHVIHKEISRIDEKLRKSWAELMERRIRKQSLEEHNIRITDQEQSRGHTAGLQNLAGSYF